MGSIYARKRNGTTYYVYQEARRVKVDPLRSGKTKGSGKSTVRTKVTYLGTAEKILNALQEKREPVGVSIREFGLVAVAYQTAVEIGLPEILSRYLTGEQGGIPCWVYFLISIINRLDQATSKNKMRQWLSKTILPDVLGLNPRKFTGKNFWYAADDILPQKQFVQSRNSTYESPHLFLALREDIFTKIEMELFSMIDDMIGLSPGVVCYDTTNFYTYFQEPKRSELANTCHSKDSKHHLKHIGLLMAVEKNSGIPLLSQVYEANRHDSRIFSCILADLILALKKMCGSRSDVVIVLDKGNNSKENFKAMHGMISWVGALVPSHHKELIERDLSRYHGSWNDLRYYRTQKNIMGIQCAVVMTFNSATARKQEHSLQRGIEKLKKEVLARWNSYKKQPKGLTRGIMRIHEKSDYGACLGISVSNGHIHLEENYEEIQSRRMRFGKNLIFSDMVAAETGDLIDTYTQRTIIESDFQLLKDETIIRFRPIRHWTDTKIRAHAFCCVLALTLMRVMQWKAHMAGYTMSPQFLKDELSDIREVIMVYNQAEAHRKITERSTVQEKLWHLFRLNEIEQVLLH